MTEEFKDYCVKKLNISSLDLFNMEKLQDSLYNPTASLTPMILEERQLRVTQMSVFDRLMMDRIIWLAGPVNDRMSTVVQAQLMFMDNIDNSPIKIHVDTPGGSVKSGLSIVDIINYIESDVATICTGMAASMGAILLGCGKKGSRMALPNSRVMIHQVSTGASGHIEDVLRSVEEGVKYNEKLFKMLGDYCGKTAEEVKLDANRDKWMDANEALEYGIIDKIVTKKV